MWRSYALKNVSYIKSGVVKLFKKKSNPEIIHFRCRGDVFTSSWHGVKASITPTEHTAPLPPLILHNKSVDTSCRLYLLPGSKPAALTAACQPVTSWVMEISFPAGGTWRRGGIEAVPYLTGKYRRLLGRGGAPSAKLRLNISVFSWCW